MNVNELRIGSCVSHLDYTDEIFKVISIEGNNGEYLITPKVGGMDIELIPLNIFVQYLLLKIYY